MRWRASGSALMRSSCCCSFGAGPRLPALRLVGAPMSSSMLTDRVSARLGRI